MFFYKKGLTCNTSLSSATDRHEKRLGAKVSKNPSPSPDSGAPETRLLTNSMPEAGIHDSSFFAEPMHKHNGGNACSTTILYIPSFLDEARFVRISISTETKMGSGKI
jgi:hypothetical protein